MGFQSVQIQYRPKVLAGIAPFYGMSTLTQATSAMVLGLSGRGTPGVIDAVFALNAPAGSGLYMYFAYPVSYGLARFLDTDSMFYGGWDGANDDPQNIYGPVTLNVSYLGVPTPFYVYRTDYPDLALCHWTASPSV